MPTIVFITTMISTLFLLSGPLSLLSGGSLPTPMENQSFLVKVVGGTGEDREFLTQYRIRAPDAAPEIISSVKEQPDSPRELFAVLSREQASRETMRRQSLKKYNLTALPSAKWVAPSPDGKRLLVGFEDRLQNTMRNVVVIEAGSLKTIKNFSYSGSTYILDAEWSSDSQIVAILYTRERRSMSSLVDILQLLSGGVPLNTIGVNFFNVSSGAISDVLIAKDVRRGGSVITRASDETKTGN